MLGWYIWSCQSICIQFLLAGVVKVTDIGCMHNKNTVLYFATMLCASESTILLSVVTFHATGDQHCQDLLPIVPMFFVFLLDDYKSSIVCTLLQSGPQGLCKQNYCVHYA